MKKLPFKTEPRVKSVVVGDATVGELEIPVLGDLTVRESNWINEKLAKQSTFLELARVSIKLAKAAKIQPYAAHDFLQRVCTEAITNQGNYTEKEKSYKVKFAREIEELTHFLLQTQWEKTVVSVAAIVRFRLEGMEDFDVDDARELPTKIVNEIFALVISEQSGEDVEEPTEKEITESLGK